MERRQVGESFFSDELRAPKMDNGMNRRATGSDFPFFIQVEKMLRRAFLR
jgi:hypothetical protein